MEPPLAVVRAVCGQLAHMSDPSGLTGRDVASLAGRLGAEPAVVVRAIAELTGRSVDVVAGEYSAAAPAPAASATPSVRVGAAGAGAEEEEVDPVEMPPEIAELLEMFARRAGVPRAMLRVQARHIETRLGSRHVDALSQWERGELARDSPCGLELLQPALDVISLLRGRPNIRKAWRRFWRELPAPPKPRERVAPRVGAAVAHAKELGEVRRKIDATRRIASPTNYLKRFPVDRADGTSGPMAFEDLLGEVRTSYRPRELHMRLACLGLPLLLQASEHLETPGGDGESRRRVQTSVNLIHYAATGRDARGSDYRAVIAALRELSDGVVEAKAGRHRSLTCEIRESPLESVVVRCDDEQWRPLRDWLKIPEARRPALGKGSGPTLELVFRESYFRDVIGGKGQGGYRMWIDRAVAWRLRGEVVPWLRMHAHTGVARRRDCWEGYGGLPWLRLCGLHSRDQRRGERLFEDDLYAMAEVDEGVRWIQTGDGHNGCAWFVVGRGARQLRASCSTRTRTRGERRRAWGHEREDRVGRRRTITSTRAQAEPARITGSSRRRRRRRQLRTAEAAAAAHVAALTRAGSPEAAGA